MSQAQGSRVQIAIIPEVTYGVTPSTSVNSTQLIEFLKFDGTLKSDTLMDESIRPDRQTSYARSGNRSAEGSLEVTFAPQNYDTLLEGALMGTWSSAGAATLKVGITDRSFAVEQGFTDLAQYRVFNGMKVNTLKLNVTTDKLVTATFGFFGSTTSAFTGTSIDTTPTAIPQQDKFYHEGGTFLEAGVVVGYLSAIDLELNNNVTGNYALGSVGYRNVTTGKLELKVKVTALFESVALYNKFLTNEDTSLSFTMTAGSGPAKTLTITCPRVKYTSGKVTMNGFAGVTVEMDGVALYDTGSATSLTVARSA